MNSFDNKSSGALPLKNALTVRLETAVLIRHTLTELNSKLADHCLGKKSEKNINADGILIFNAKASLILTHDPLIK